MVPHKGDYLVSWNDVSGIFRPVLQPRYHPAAAQFMTVIIDAGHGGTDSGAMSKWGREKDLCLQAARKLGEELKKRGFRVAMTRDADKFISLTDRVKMANDIDHAVYVSIHFNLSRPQDQEGIETFTLSRAAEHRSRTRESANVALAQAIHHSCLRGTGRADRGIRLARFTTQREINHPSILLEGGYLSHPVEGELISGEEYQSNLARALADAIVKYQKTLAERIAKQEKKP